MKSSEIRNQFLDYFKGKGHAIVASSPLVPGNDPTLLFTNSGMVQFKEVFLGQEQRNYVRATTSQRCVRAGGKHNDLENVGYTARHHTFFEMLGNFSFGDYFKRDAIHFAWELLTAVYKLPQDRLWVTVYETDDEAYNLWANEIRVPRERIARIGDKPGGAKFQSDNFWQMGETGPCGPCTEIFYDHGPEVAGGPPGTPEAEGDRYIEIWNLVFMQFNRDEHGRLNPLPKPSVDTGMGLERIAAILQGVHSNYDIDIFRDLIRAAERETKFPKILDAEGQIYSEKQKLFSRSSLNVIADHVRACAFLIVDGVIPGNEGRGYVLRRIIRRAIRHGYKLGRKQPFFHRIVPDLAGAMGEAYPELAAARERVAQVLEQEERRFADTLENGMAVLEGALRSEDRMLDGDTVFRLYDTFGFPLDLTADIARERGVTVDFAGNIDGSEFAGGKASNATLVLGEGRMLPDFETGLNGIAPGESRTFPVGFPADYGAKEVAGKSASFEVTVKKVEAPKLPDLDAEFARSLGVADGDLARMRAEVKANVEREVRKRVHGEIKQKVMQALLDSTQIELPKSLIGIEIQRLQQQARTDLESRGLKSDQIPLNPEIFEAQAKRRVALGLIIGETVKEHGVAATPAQVRSLVDDFAQTYEQPSEVVKWFYSEPQRLAEFEGLALESNVVKWVLENAKVEDKAVSFDELMGKPA